MKFKYFPNKLFIFTYQSWKQCHKFIVLLMLLQLTFFFGFTSVTASIAATTMSQWWYSSNSNHYSIVWFLILFMLWCVYTYVYITYMSVSTKAWNFHSTHVTFITFFISNRVCANHIHHIVYSKFWSMQQKMVYFESSIRVI